MTMDRKFQIEGKPEFKIEVDAEGRITISVQGLVIDVHLAEEGATVQMQHEAEVLDECSADYPDLVNAQG